MASRIVVLGGSFAGLSAAFALKHDLGDKAEITVSHATRASSFSHR